MPAIAKINFTQVLSMAAAITDNINRIVSVFSLIRPFDHRPNPKPTALMTIINLDRRFPIDEPSLHINWNYIFICPTDWTHIK